MFRVFNTFSSRQLTNFWKIFLLTGEIFFFLLIDFRKIHRVSIHYSRLIWIYQQKLWEIETWCEETEEGTRTCYSFYRKPMANPVDIPAKSAVPDSIKYSTFRQEVGRILRNTSVHLPWCHKAALLSSFSWRLKVS